LCSLDDDDGGPSSGSKGKAWFGSDRDYSYDEVSLLELRIDVHQNSLKLGVSKIAAHAGGTKQYSL